MLRLLLLLLLHLVLAYTALCSIELGFRVLPVHAPARAGWDLGFGVWGLGFGVWGLGFEVWGLTIHAPQLPLLLGRQCAPLWRHRQVMALCTEGAQCCCRCSSSTSSTSSSSNLLLITCRRRRKHFFCRLELLAAVGAPGAAEAAAVLGREFLPEGCFGEAEATVGEGAGGEGGGFVGVFLGG